MYVVCSTGVDLEEVFSVVGFKFNFPVSGECLFLTFIELTVEWNFE